MSDEEDWEWFEEELDEDFGTPAKIPKEVQGTMFQKILELVNRLEERLQQLEENFKSPRGDPVPKAEGRDKNNLELHSYTLSSPSSQKAIFHSLTKAENPNLQNKASTVELRKTLEDKLNYTVEMLLAEMSVHPPKRRSV